MVKYFPQDGYQSSEIRLGAIQIPGPQSMGHLQRFRRIIGNLDNQGDIQEKMLDGNKVLEVFMIVDQEDYNLRLF